MKKVLIYGSSLLTQVTVNYLQANAVCGHELIGHIPCKSPTVTGSISLPVVEEIAPHDIKLCVGYDMRIADFQNAYNVHPGLLPEYGGCNILHHSVVNNAAEQGFTFQKMISQYDAGPIISKLSYPVFPSDTVISLYKRMLRIYPPFVKHCLELLSILSKDDLDTLPETNPRMYLRKDIAEQDRSTYMKNYEELQKIGAELRGK